jgi:hypothetical protein
MVNFLTATPPQMTNRYTINTPALLQRHQMLRGCLYTSGPTINDAKTGWNWNSYCQHTGAVQPTQTIYIKAKLAGCTSVLMAKAAALVLAATATECMDLNNIRFLSDCEQLVQFLTAADQANPSD